MRRGGQTGGPRGRTGSAGGSAGSLLVVTCLATLVLSGCGGTASRSGLTNGASTPTSQGAAPHTASTPSAASSGNAIASLEFKFGARTICERLRRSLVRPSGKSVTIAEIARVAPKNAALERKAIEGLSALTPPSSVAASWARVLTIRRHLSEELSKLASDARAHNVAGLNALATSKQKNRAAVAAAATQAGVPACGTFS